MCLLMISPCYALQIKSVVDNETVTAKVSAMDVTRIFVEGDRIKSVKGIRGAYTRENDEEKGEIYIQPTTEHQERAFTILIETEQERHFTLLLTPTKTPAETIMIVSKGVGRVKAEKFEASSPYEQSLVNLIQAMKKRQLPQGYASQQVEKRKAVVISGLHVKLRCIYDGYHFSGEVYEIVNKSSYPILIDERDFYKAGVRAISVETREIPAGARIQLYRVGSHA